MEEYFDYIGKLMDECDRRFKDADQKVCLYVCSRLKTCVNSLNLLKSSKIHDSTEFQSVSIEDINLLSDNIAELLKHWEQRSSFKPSKNNMDRICQNANSYKAKTVCEGLKGRPPYKLNFELIDSLLDLSFNFKDISHILGISRSTLWRHLKKSGFDFSNKYSNISNKQLDEIISKFKSDHSLAGERMVIGYLRSQGIRLPRSKVRESIHRVDPLNVALRWFRSNPRWIYSVPGPNSLWHNDGLHKLVHWGIYVHSCIDGYSRLITYLLCADNNRAITVLHAFLQAVEEFGLPSRVRGDYGTENNALEKFMLETQKHNGAYIRGPSVHNQRIERLHYDTTHCVLSHYIDLFLSMEENELLDRNSLIDLLSVHFVFIPMIQKSLDIFLRGWNNHSLSSEGNKTPYQLFTLGMMDDSKKDQRGVVSFVNKSHVDLASYGVSLVSNSAFQDDEDEFEPPENFVELKEELYPKLRQTFSDICDDGNFGIDNFVSVRAEIIKLLN